MFVQSLWDAEGELDCSLCVFVTSVSAGRRSRSVATRPDARRSWKHPSDNLDLGDDVDRDFPVMAVEKRVFTLNFRKHVTLDGSQN